MNSDYPPPTHKIKFAYSLAVPSRRGNKPDFATGTPWDDLTPIQRRVRTALTYEMINAEDTVDKLGDYVTQGGTFAAQHTGGKECRYKWDRRRNGEIVPHVCRNRVHRCNANFVAAGFLAADFDTLTDINQIYDNHLVQDYAGLLYHTSSSYRGADRTPKMRVVFALGQPVIEGPTNRDFVKAMQWMFQGLPDPACTDHCRLYFGCEDTVMDFNRRILPYEVALEWLAEFNAYLDAKPKPKVQPQRIFKPGEHLTGAEARRVQNFMDAVIRKSTEKIRAASVGQRHHTLLKSGYNLYTFVYGGVLDEAIARQVLEDAYRTHNRMSDFEDLIEWCKEHAMEKPNSVPEPSFKFSLFPSFTLNEKPLPTIKYTARKGYK